MRLAEVRVWDWPPKLYQIPIQLRSALAVGSFVVVDSPEHGYVCGEVKSFQNSTNPSEHPWLVDLIDTTAYMQLSDKTPTAVLLHSDYDKQPFPTDKDSNERTDTDPSTDTDDTTG